MPNYKLYYFNMKGRAELARLILAYAGIEFEDVRYERDEWLQHKPKFPFHQLPVLEVDGKMLAQSRAIARYLAKKCDLAGKDEWEQAQVDMYVDCVDDVVHGMRSVHLEKDAEKRKEEFTKWIAERVNPHLSIIEKHVQENGSGYLVGSEVTWADLGYFAFLSMVSDRHATLLNDVPHLQNYVERIGNIPAVKQWVMTRPKTEY